MFKLFQQCVVDVVDVNDKYFNYLIGIEQYLVCYLYVGGGIVVIYYYRNGMFRRFLSDCYDIDISLCQCGEEFC